MKRKINNEKIGKNMQIMSYFEVFSNAVVALTAVAGYIFLKNQIFILRSVSLENAITEHNKRIGDDTFKRVALDFFHRRDSVHKFVTDREANLVQNEGGFYHRFWATRSMHMSHINLLAYAFKISGGDFSRFEREQRGLAILARNVYRDLYNYDDGLDSRPEWYRLGCESIDLRNKDSARTWMAWDKYTRMILTKEESDFGKSKYRI